MTDGKIISENNTKARADDDSKVGSVEEVNEVSSKNGSGKDDEEIEVMVEGEDGELEPADKVDDEAAAAEEEAEVKEGEVVEESGGGEEETLEGEVVEESGGGEEETLEGEVVEESGGGEEETLEGEVVEESGGGEEETLEGEVVEESGGGEEETLEGEVVEVVEEEPKEDARIRVLQEELEEVKAERDKLLKDTAKLKERVLRSAADMENLRRRTRREINDHKIKGKESVVSEMLTVVDNLERAMEHVESDGSLESMVEGVRLVLRQFSTAMEKLGVEAFSSKGKPFDPVYHEAVGQVETKEVEPNTVVEEWQKGYQIDGRLLRPAVVVVSKTPMNEGEESSESGEGKSGEDEGGGRGVEEPSTDEENKVEGRSAGDERNEGVDDEGGGDGKGVGDTSAGKDTESEEEETFDN